jgi:5-methylcytosine-specific restriction endonuclease McrA
VSRNRVFVVLDPATGKPSRILRRVDYKVSGPVPIEWPRTDAVRSIRQQVYERDKECQRCGKPLTWKTLHCDEKISKGEGGEISLENCWGLCASCHILSPTSEHGNRRLRFNERNDA